MERKHLGDSDWKMSKEMVDGPMATMKQLDVLGESDFPDITWEWLLGQLNKLTLEQLRQPVQIFHPHARLDKPVLLQPAYSFGTIEELCHVDGEVVQETRGPDFAHHPEQVVLCVDGAPFSETGDTMWTMEDGGLRGNVTGELRPFGGHRAVHDPGDWSVYGKMAWRLFRLERERRAGGDASFDEINGLWGKLPQDSKDIWTSVAKSVALAAFPSLDLAEPKKG